jgi:hypothetical protein
VNSALDQMQAHPQIMLLLGLVAALLVLRIVAKLACLALTIVMVLGTAAILIPAILK